MNQGNFNAESVSVDGVSRIEDPDNLTNRSFEFSKILRYNRRCIKVIKRCLTFCTLLKLYAIIFKNSVQDLCVEPQ